MEKFEEKIELEPEKEPEIKRPKFEIEEFENARESFENLTKQLTPAIRQHEYNLIIGDDVSGRLTTRVVEGLLREVYQEDKTKPPQVLFFAGGIRRRKEWQKIRGVISNHIRDLIHTNIINPAETSALLTTEYICSGESINNLFRAFKEVGLPCDIATLGHSFSLDDIKDIKRCYKNLKKVNNIYSGGSGLHFWPLRNLAGVKKTQEEIFSSRKEGVREEVKAARRDIKKMVNYLKQIYDREKEKIEK